MSVFLSLKKKKKNTLAFFKWIKKNFKKNFAANFIKEEKKNVSIINKLEVENNKSCIINCYDQ